MHRKYAVLHVNSVKEFAAGIKLCGLENKTLNFLNVFPIEIEQVPNVFNVFFNT